MLVKQTGEVGKFSGDGDPATTLSSARAIKVGLVGNVITQSLTQIGERIRDICAASLEHLDFGQVIQTLESNREFDFLIVHLDHRWFFDIAPNVESVERAHELAERVQRWLDRGPGTVLLNTIPYLPRSLVERDLHQQIESINGIHSVLFKLAEVNERVSIVDVSGALAAVGYSIGLRERNRVLMQAPYAPVAAAAIVNGYSLAIRSFLQARRKVIVVDADNTLWGGIVGEVGYESVAIDREYPGIIHFTLQQQLKRLRSLGVILCVVTKNNEMDFLEVFEKRSMPLELADFTIYKSNWNPKSENIQAIANELNIGLDAIVFLDDNRFEIEEVQARLPQVDCHLFPFERAEEALMVLDQIESLRTRSLTSEDIDKAEQYRTEAERKQVRLAAPSLKEYIASLNIELHVNINSAANLRRITQLTNKTNQFNLTCQRYVESEIERAMAQGHVYDFRVIDRFGDMGIVGVVIVRNGLIENFLMSCRALGRQVEVAILSYICDHHPQVHGIYKTGQRNQMVARFYPENGFVLEAVHGEEQIFKLDKGPIDEQNFIIISGN